METRRFGYGKLGEWREVNQHFRKIYKQVRLANILGKESIYATHTLILTLFIGPRPTGMLGLHKDDDPMNNWLDNLYWGIQQENSNDMVRNGHSLTGEKHGRSKLTEKDVLEIRRRKKEGEESYSIKADYPHIACGTFYEAMQGKTWKYLPME